MTDTKRNFRNTFFSLFLGGMIVLLCSSSISNNSNRNPGSRPPLQPIPIDTTRTFINYSANRLHVATDSTLARRFFNKWYDVTTTGKGNINIMQIGGSHVQGGMLPHQIRRNILRYYPDLVASRGMIFPYSMGKKCNNPFDYKVRRSHYLELTRNVYKDPQQRLGLCGIAVTARDSVATIGIVMNEPDISFHTTQVILLGYSPNGVVPSLRQGHSELVPTKIDSTRDQFIFNLIAPADSFTIVLPCDSAQSFTLTGIYLRNKNNGISYHSIGVNGASVPDYFKCPSLVRDLHLVNPDMVVFGIGINDASQPNFDTADFKRNYLRLCDSIRKVNPDCFFVFITNNDSFKKVGKKYVVNQNGLLARDVFYRLAEETGGAVWDQFEVMGGLKSMDKWRLAQLAQSDRVHFTRAGYELVGDLFSNAFVEALQYFLIAPSKAPLRDVQKRLYR